MHLTYSQRRPSYMRIVKTWTTNKTSSGFNNFIFCEWEYEQEQRLEEDVISAQNLEALTKMLVTPSGSKQ